MNLELLQFTRNALEKGASREEIAAALKTAGWRETDVRAAADAFAPVPFPVPVPRPRPYLSAQEFFIYAVFFTAVYLSAWNLVWLGFKFVDLALPEASARASMPAIIAPADRTMIFSQMRANIAALIVAFPLFLFMHRHIGRAIAADPTKRQSGLRKWMTYITLFIAASALIGDLSALVFNVLNGALTVRVILQLATVAAVAGGGFGYFLWDIRRDERP